MGVDHEQEGQEVKSPTSSASRLAMSKKYVLLSLAITPLVVSMAGAIALIWCGTMFVCIIITI